MSNDKPSEETLYFVPWDLNNVKGNKGSREKTTWILWNPSLQILFYLSIKNKTLYVSITLWLNCKIIQILIEIEKSSSWENFSEKSWVHLLLISRFWGLVLLNFSFSTCLEICNLHFFLSMQADTHSCESVISHRS